MIRDPGQLAVYVRPGLTDMRKQINGLAIIAEEEMRLDPLYDRFFCCIDSLFRIRIDQVYVSTEVSIGQSESSRVSRAKSTNGGLTIGEHYTSFVIATRTPCYEFGTFHKELYRL